MTPILLLQRLIDAGVIVTVVNGELRFRARPGAYTDELRATVDQNRQGFIAWLTAEDLGPIPTEYRTRAFWLAALARRAGMNAEALMVFIDETIGYRSTGPFELTKSKTMVIADALRANIGIRPAITSKSESSAMPVEVAVPTSIRRKVDLGWSDSRFSALCQRVLGHPGLRRREDDARILAKLERLEGGQPR